MSERLVKIYFDRIYKKTSIGLATVRAGNVIGGGDFSDDRIVPDIIKHITKKKKLLLRNPKSYRPWQHVFDVLSGYLILGVKLSINNKKFSGPYNFGPKSKKNYTVKDLVHKFMKRLIIKSYKIFYSKKYFFEPSYLGINSNKSRSKLKWKSKYSPSNMIEKTIDWYKVFIKNPKKIERFSRKQVFEYFSDL